MLSIGNPAVLNFSGLTRLLMLATQLGGLGVNLFFVLSGFLITGILLDSKEKPQYFRRFYTRRALRILPAYYLLLILLAVLHSASMAFLGLSFVYLANLTGLFGMACGYGPLWSLAVEEHYYIICSPVIYKLTRRHVAIVAIALCLLMPVLRAVSFTWDTLSGLAHIPRTSLMHSRPAVCSPFFFEPRPREKWSLFFVGLC